MPEKVEQGERIKANEWYNCIKSNGIKWITQYIMSAYTVDLLGVPSLIH